MISQTTVSTKAAESRPTTAAILQDFFHQADLKIQAEMGTT